MPNGSGRSWQLYRGAGRPRAMSDQPNGLTTVLNAGPRNAVVTRDLEDGPR